MAESHYNITFEQLAGLNWQEVLEKCDTRDCLYYHTALYAKASECEKAKDDVGVRVFRFLGSLASLHLNASAPDFPFEPMIQTSTGRSALVDDYAETDLDVIEKLVPITRDPEFRARLADVLWLRTRRITAAETAIAAYLDSAKNLEDPEMWPRFFPQVERAFRLAATIGKRGQPLKVAVQFVEELIGRHAKSDTGLLTARAMELLLDHGQGDADNLIGLSKDLALRAEKNANWLFARTYWDLNARWNERSKKKDDAKAARIRSAETFLSDAQAALGRDSSSYFAAAHFLSQGLEALRRAGAGRDRLEEVHKKLLEYNKRSTEELREYSAPPIDISEFVKSATALVRGKSLQDAVLLLAITQPPTRAKELRQQVEKNAKDFPLAHLFSSVALDEHGKVIAQKPSLLTNDPAQLEAAVRAEMFHHAHINWQLRAQAFINPGRTQIWEEHRPSPSDLKFLILENPFVPPGRENIFARGIHAGFSGDLLAAAHLLIPQIENSIRYVLTSNGILTSKQSSRLIQQERELNSLLRFPEVTEIFGEDIVFDLQGILVERFGANLRNRFAHGLVENSSFYSVEVVYCWWLVLRLLAIPVAQNAPPAIGEQTSSQRIDAAQTVSDMLQSDDQSNPEEIGVADQTSETVSSNSDA